MIDPTPAMAEAFEQARRAYWTTQGHEAPEGGPTVGEHRQAATMQALAAVFELVERDYDVRRREVVHRAVKGDSYVHCCGIELLDLPRGHRWTLDPHGVTCKGPS